MPGKKTPRALACLFLQAALAATCLAHAGTDSTRAARAGGGLVRPPSAEKISAPRADSTARGAALRSSGTGSAAIAVSILKGLAARRKGRRRTPEARNPAALLRALSAPGAPAGDKKAASK